MHRSERRNKNDILYTSSTGRSNSIVSANVGALGLLGQEQ